MGGHWWSVVTVWAATLAAALALALRGPVGAAAELATLVLAVAVVVAFVLQLVVADRVGFVARLTASVCGSFVIVVVTTALSLLR